MEEHFEKITPTSSSSKSILEEECDEDLKTPHSISQDLYDFVLSSSIESDSGPEEQLQQQNYLPREFQSALTAKSKSKSKSKKKTKRNRNKFRVKSRSDFYTEGDADSSDEELSVELPEEFYQEFLANWESYWAENGERIVWDSWNRKYKNYINPDYDLVDFIKNTKLCSSSEDSDGEGKEKSNTKKKSNTMGKHKEIKFNDDDEPEPVASTSTSTNGNGNCDSEESESLKRKKTESSSSDETDESVAEVDAEIETDPEKQWQETWNQHAQEESLAEYSVFYKRMHKQQVKKMRTFNCASPANMKYWNQRYQLFSKYDEGIKLDEESWFSVTPEKIALHTANKFVQMGCAGVIVDAFCGCGGNTIQFAMQCKKVIAVDIDPIKIEMCKHNARIYGVEDKIEFIVGDFMTLAPTIKGDAVFLSPPWGGPGYQAAPIFDIKTMIPMDGFALFEAAKEISNNIAYFLPRNVDKHQCDQLAGIGNYVEVERNCQNNRVKTITAYYGQLVRMPFKIRVA